LFIFHYRKDHTVVLENHTVKAHFSHGLAYIL